MTMRVHPGRDIDVKTPTPSHPLFPFLSLDEKGSYTTGAAVCYDGLFPFECKEKAPQVMDFNHASQEMPLSR